MSTDYDEYSREEFERDQFGQQTYPTWISITRLGSMFEEEMTLDRPRQYRHRPRALDPRKDRASSSWNPGLAPDHPNWNHS